MWEEGSVVRQVLNGMKDKGVRHGRSLDVTGKSKIKSIDNCGFWDNSGIGIFGGGVNLVIVGKGISGGEFGTWKNFPNDIKVL